MTAAPLARRALALYVAFLASIALLAALVAASSVGAEARALLPLGFGHLAQRPATALEIALGNARVALLPMALSFVAHQARWLRALADLLVGGQLGLNLAQLVAAVGGYGVRALAALTPHAFVEFGAYAIVGAVYLDGRRRRPLTSAFLGAAALCALLLLAAAGLETYVQWRVA